MRDEAIRAALEKAARVLVAEGMESVMPGEGVREHWLTQQPTSEAQRQVAVAIAAFLRALPRNGLRLEDEYKRGIYGSCENWHGMLAAAVERAAKEAGDDPR